MEDLEIMKKKYNKISKNYLSLIKKLTNDMIIKKSNIRASMNKIEIEIIKKNKIRKSMNKNEIEIIKKKKIKD